MTAATLAGARILVLEDHFYLAADVSAALTREGATVLGPFGNEDDALPFVDPAEVDCAILDVNLGPGQSFRVARAMQSHRIPFVFVTGYDEDAIPPELSQVRRLQKPCHERELLKAVRQLL